MAEVKRFIRPLISVVLIGASVLGLLNVYGDNTEVQASAGTVACGGHDDCTPQLRQFSRSPLGQSFTFALGYQPGKRNNRPTEAAVRCKRAYILLGAYSCAPE